MARGHAKFERRRHEPLPPRGGREALGGARKPRADAQRNRDGLLEAAKAAFAEWGRRRASTRSRGGRASGSARFTVTSRPATRSSRRSIAARSSNWPTPRRASPNSLPPAEALARLDGLFIDYIAAKKVIAPALKSLVGGGSALYADSSARITGRSRLLVERARASGDIRPDADSADLLRALIGFAYVNSAPDWEASARRLIDLLIDGLRSQGGEK